MTTKTDSAAASDNRKGKRYSEEFQQKAVRILEAGRSLAQLSRELGVSTWSLRRWTTRHGAGSAVSLAVELAEVRAELRTVTRQREILKKALAILGQESPSGIF